MKIYVASSWRNNEQPGIVLLLRSLGHEVYDFKNPPNGSGFGWRQCAMPDENPEAFREMMKDPAFFRDHVLPHPVAQAGFDSDMTALRECDACVLVLPCGRSAHLELGWAVGAKKRTIVLLDDPMSEPELMYLMVTKICVDLVELKAALE